ETCSSPEFFCREERLKNARARSGVHSDARIADGQHDERSRFYADVSMRVRQIKRGVVRLDGQLSASRHCISCVDGEIHEDLSELSIIRLDHSCCRIQNRNEIDVFPEYAGKHLQVTLNHLIQIQDARLQDLLPSEREKLPRQFRGFVSRFSDLFQML